MFYKIKLLLALALISIVNCEPPSTSYGTPIGVPISSYGTPNYDVNGNNGHNSGHNDHHNNDDHGEPKSYEFGYQVKDDYTGNNYNRRESSDGNQVRGEYRVQLPDGRTQIVTYYADWQTGFHADVRYEGTAQYPDQYNNNNNYNNNGVSNQYGPPNYNNNNNYNNGYNNNGGYSNGGYNNGGFGGSNPATSSVTIKDYSGNDNNNYNNNNGGYHY